MSASSSSNESSNIDLTNQPAAAGATAPAVKAVSTVMTISDRQALIAELERDGFTVLGLTGKPAALETMRVRISRGQVGLGKSAWQAIGSPGAVLGLQRGNERVLALIASSKDEANALNVEWDTKLELAFIRGASWIGSVLGTGNKVTLIDVVFERNRLIVDATKVSAAEGKRQAIKPSAKAGVGARRGVGARGVANATGDKA